MDFNELLKFDWEKLSLVATLAMMLIVMMVGAYRRWWVPGPIYWDVVRERDKRDEYIKQLLESLEQLSRSKVIGRKP